LTSASATKSSPCSSAAPITAALTQFALPVAKFLFAPRLLSKPATQVFYEMHTFNISILSSALAYPPPKAISGCLRRLTLRLGDQLFGFRFLQRVSSGELGFQNLHAGSIEGLREFNVHLARFDVMYEHTVQYQFDRPDSLSPESGSRADFLQNQLVALLLINVTARDNRYNNELEVEEVPCTEKRLIVYVVEATNFDDLYLADCVTRICCKRRA
jgi:hypothetical protein